MDTPPPDGQHDSTDNSTDSTGTTCARTGAQHPEGPPPDSDPVTGPTPGGPTTVTSPALDPAPARSGAALGAPAPIQPPRPSDAVVGRPTIDRRTAYAIEAITDLDGFRTYTDPETGAAWASVTSILGASVNKPWLGDWGGKTAATWAVDRLDLIRMTRDEASRSDAIKLISSNGRRIRQVKADAGKWVHEYIARFIYELSDRTGRAVPLPDLPEEFIDVVVDDDTGMLTQTFVDVCTEGFLAFVEDWEPTFLAAEMTVADPELEHAGTLDSILEVNIGADTLRTHFGVPLPEWVSGLVRVRVYVDVKTGKKLDLTWRAQLAAYRRAPVALLHGEGIVPITPAPEGTPTLTATLHLRPEYERGYRLMLCSVAEDAEGWEEFCLARELYQQRQTRRGKPGRVIYPPLANGEQPPMRLADLDAEGYGGAPTALRKVRDVGPDGEPGRHLFVTVADLAGWTRTELLACKGIGEAAVGNIERIAADHGITLGVPTLATSGLEPDVAAALEAAGLSTPAAIAELDYAALLTVCGGKKLKANRVRKWLLAEGTDLRDPDAPAPRRVMGARISEGVA